MGDFLGEMADMMSQATPTVCFIYHCSFQNIRCAVQPPPGPYVPRLLIRTLNERVSGCSVLSRVQESFEELQQLFVDMFQDDIMAGICGGPRPGQCAQSRSAPPCQPSSPSRPRPARTSQRTPPSCNGFSKRGSSAMGSGKPSWRPGRAGLSPGLGLSGFCFKVSCYYFFASMSY
jgi:hypothetical protein